MQLDSLKKRPTDNSNCLTFTHMHRFSHRLATYHKIFSLFTLAVFIFSDNQESLLEGSVFGRHDYQIQNL